MSNKLKSHVQNIGDTDVYADEDFVQVTVDGDTAIFMDKQNAEVLAKAILKALEVN